ncbi:MAG: hypothetical protein KDK91_04190, partial [Gammaproteobacteria bacterium]|nr:hypothetical protein [Gammaproteobacteria bacterium]
MSAEGTGGAGPVTFGWLWVVALFSLLINLLYLTGPIFMLQIYDRVLASANVATLIGLLLIVVLL